MAKIYTSKNLLDNAHIQNAFNILDSVEAAKQNERQAWAGLGKSIFAPENAGAVVQNILETKNREKIFDDEMSKYGDSYKEISSDPTFSAMKEEYIRTGNSTPISTYMNNYEAQKRRIADETKAALEAKNFAKDSYDISLADWNKNKNALDLLQPTDPDYNTKKNQLESEITKNEVNLRKYGKQVWGDEYELPTRLTSEPIVENEVIVPETPVEPVLNTTEIKNHITSTLSKGKYKYTTAELAQLQNEVDSLPDTVKEKGDYQKSINEAKKYTLENKPTYDPAKDMKNLGDKAARERLKKAGYTVKIVNGEWKVL